ncbi:MAG: hypothetical protein JSC189_001039 [Candidatus Tokpelaia sp. JSC189]|nr:MAG: hypothetical protein JSC189_001039 [Candidatus Tokpelaia sp. JSC189]
MTKLTKIPALTYNGLLIHEKGEKLCLTDMWRAAGSNETQRPNDWLNQEGTKTFVEYLAENLNASKNGNEVIQTVRGGKNPGTLADSLDLREISLT